MSDAATVKPPSVDPRHAYAFLRVLRSPDEVLEVRGLRGIRKPIDSGYFDFDSIELASRCAVSLDAPGIYVTLNPVRSELHSRAFNRIEKRADHTTADEQITRRKWLFIDIDPQRLSGISATDEEHTKALGRADQVQAWLVEEHQWNRPIVIDSGNGSYLLFPIDLPNDADALRLVERVLKSISGRWSDDGVKIDSTVANASRIMRLPGTINRKGDSSPERPHRACRGLKLPNYLKDGWSNPITREKLEAVASLVFDDIDTRLCGQQKGPLNFDGENSREVALEALSKLNPQRIDNRDEWIKVGMALHSVDSSAAMFAEWDQWSTGSSKYIAGECASKWKGFTARGIGIGTLIKWAMEDSTGWRPTRYPQPRPNPSRSDSRSEARTEKPSLIILANFAERFVPGSDGGDAKMVREPVPIGAMIDRAKQATGGWPKQCGGQLFVHHKPDHVQWLAKTASLIGYIGSVAGVPPNFRGESGYHSKEEFFAEYLRTSESFEAVETLPHEPPMPGHYYACRDYLPGDGRCIEWILNRLNPETELDRDLLKAAMATPFVGLPGGSRPAFALTSDHGRGSGKSTVLAIISAIAGGALEVSSKEDMGTIIQRLLSDEGRAMRIASLDNVKSHRFSFAELEGLITSPVISGKRLYVGEGRRPNTLTWFVTMNGLSLSTDLAQRIVTIKLSKPKFSGTWAEETFSFIREHRDEVISDIIGFLQSERTTLTAHSRWAAWEREVLSRLPEPADAQRLIQERAELADVEREEGELLDEFFGEQLRRLDYSIDHCRIFIPNENATRWFNWATGEQKTTTGVSRALKLQIKSGQIKRIQECPSRTHGRGYFWVGEQCVSKDAFLDLSARLQQRGDRVNAQSASSMQIDTADFT